MSEVGQKEQSLNWLVTMACHDTSGPLLSLNYSLNKLLELLQKSNDRQTCIAQIEKAIRYYQQLNEILKRVRYFHTSESGQLKVSLLPTSLSAVVDSCVADFQSLIESKNIQFEIVKVYSQPLFALSDECLLKDHILNNLVLNSIKYSPLNGKVVIILFNNHLGQHVLIANQGQAISDKQAKMILSHPFEADNLNSSENAGSGLGLPLAKSLVQQMSGQLSWIDMKNIDWQTKLQIDLGPHWEKISFMPNVFCVTLKNLDNHSAFIG